MIEFVFNGRRVCMSFSDRNIKTKCFEKGQIKLLTDRRGSAPLAEPWDLATISPNLTLRTFIKRPEMILKVK